MQTVIRPLAIVVAAMALAGPAVAARVSTPAASPYQQAQAQPVNAAATKPASTKPASTTTLVATGKILTFDAIGQALTLSTSKGEQHFTVGPSARLHDSSHTITAADLGKLAGHKATVRYRESAGQKSVESIRVAAATAKTATKS